MKKLMFSSLACVAFAFSGFASNEVVNEEKVSKENVVIETDATESSFKEDQVEFVKNCVYEIISSTGTTYITITNVPDETACN